MGFKQIELVPISLAGPTPTQPSGKSTNAKIFQVTRSDTVNIEKCVLPAAASVLAINIHGSVSSDAGTTAVVTITIVNNTGTISTGSYDVKANGTVSALIQMTALPNIENLPVSGDLIIKAVYAETGGASTTGGPWVFDVSYVS